MLKTCGFCKKEFKTIPSKINIGKGNYCSRRCYGLSQRGKTPWNKGVTGYKQPKISLAMLGKKRTCIQGEKHYKWKGGKPKCEICGKPLSLYKYKYCLEHRQVKKGDKMWNWKGGITPLNKKIRHSIEFKRWREEVFLRDNYQCQLCGAKNGDGTNVELHPHHIKPFAYFPELRFVVENGKTLCKGCHELTDTYKTKQKEEICQARYL